LTEQDYLTLVRSHDLDQLEKAWEAALDDPGDVRHYRLTLDELCANDSAAVAVRLASSMIDALTLQGRIADATELANTIVSRGAHNDGLARRLLELLTQQHGEEAWFDLILELSGLSQENLALGAFLAFERFRHYTPGHAVYHPAGWGEGLVDSLDSAARTLVVRFVAGRTQEFPITSAIESLKPLGSTDLRAMRILAPDELQRLVDEEPAVLIRKAAEIYRGRITSTQVKTELSPSVVPAKKWAGYWKRAKTAAANDPWLQVEGSATRPVFVLRKKPLSLADEAARALRHAGNLAEAIVTCRDYLGRGLDDHARSVIIDLATQRVMAALEQRTEAHVHLLEGILLLEEQGRPCPASAAAELRAVLLDDAEQRLQPDAFDTLATQESRTLAVRLLPAALGDSWADTCVECITRFPTSVVEAVVELLVTNGQGHRLLAAWRDVAPYPRRHAVLTYLLGKLYAEGVFDSADERPTLVGVCRVLLHLMRIVAKERKVDPILARVRARLTSLLVGRLSLLTRCLDTIGRDDLEVFLGIAERGGQDFPQEVSAAILKTIARKYPDITSKPEKPFWDNDDVIFVTAEGLRRHQEDYRQLVDVKIPANSKAIGVAASHGDLSENSEWEAAMEEQRNLTTRADIMDKELRRARLLDEQDMPENVVAPGTRVTFVYTSSGRRASYRILGPWDCVADDVINYKAPLAAALLGSTVGGETQLDGPEGPQTVRIEAVQRVV
jgi:transcription elongation GreA/GreB family factor